MFVAFGTLAFLGLAFWFYKAVLMSPELEYHSFMYKVKAKLFFWLGDIRYPWGVREHKIDLKDAKRGALVSRPGDIGLHRDDGYLSNLGIPGAFKHAWVVVDRADCVEAISEGVVLRDEMYPLLSDYAVILRPKGVSRTDTKVAVERAHEMVGCEYDANFNFDFEASDQEFSREFEQLREIKQYSRNLSVYHPAFSCTETAAFSWFHCRKALGIFRTVHAGREAVVADDFLSMNFEIAWVSPSVTVEWARAARLHEHGVEKIREYWSSVE